jgi:hypothetical protein
MKKMGLSISRTVLVFCLLIFLAGLQSINAENMQTVEGVWQVLSINNCPECQDSVGQNITIARSGNGYKAGSLNCFGNNSHITCTTQIDLGLGGFGIPPQVAQQVAGQKIALSTSYSLLGDGNSLRMAVDMPYFYWDPRTYRFLRYEMRQGYAVGVLRRLSGPAQETPVQKAYRADCGAGDPDKPTPADELCPGNLVAMTYFCGGDRGCSYVCCPKGFPYLNHCDCKCYATSNFDCHSYSYCREKLIQ